MKITTNPLAIVCLFFCGVFLHSNIFAALGSLIAALIAAWGTTTTEQD